MSKRTVQNPLLVTHSENFSHDREHPVDFHHCLRSHFMVQVASDSYPGWFSER